MDFWIPVLIIFTTALVGALVRMHSRDTCLRVFQGCPVFLKLKDGRWISGALFVYANSIELRYEKPPAGNGRFQKLSYVLYEESLATIDKILRLSPPPQTPEYRSWKREVDRLQQPGLIRILGRKTRNLFSILRDAFAQAVPVVFGAVKKRSWLGKAPGGDDRVGEMGRTLANVIPNAYEPILEKYLGHKVVVEREPEETHEEAGVLQEYTAKFILVRDVQLIEEAPPDPALSQIANEIFDVIFPRPLYLVRHLASPQNGAVNGAAFQSTNERVSAPEPALQKE